MDQKIWKTINVPTCPPAPSPSCQDLWKETQVVRKSHFIKQGMIHVLLFLVWCKGFADFFLLLGLYSGSTLKSDLILVIGLRIKLLCVTIQMKATEKFFNVVLFILPYKVLLYLTRIIPRLF